MAEPTELPIWDENDTNTDVIPDTLKDDGFGLKQKAPSPIFNSWFRNVYKWIEWFKAKFLLVDADIERLQPVESILALRALDITDYSNGATINVTGYDEKGDGGGGPIRYLDTGKIVGYYTDNGGSIIVPDGGDGSAAWLWGTLGVNNLREWGCKGDYITDDTIRRDACALDCKNNRLAMYAPSGGYVFSTPLESPSAEQESYAIYGDGASLTAFMFESCDGVLFYGAYMSMRELSIFDRKSFATPPTSYPVLLPIEGNITPNVIGLYIAANNCNIKNVVIMGFDSGVYTTGVKFYSTLTQVRANFNLIGLYNDTNFIRSYGCQYLLNFNKDVEIHSGQHSFHDTSLEGCGDYDANNANFPNGGIHVLEGASGYFDNCWMEDLNFFNFGAVTVNNVNGIFPMITMSPHFRMLEQAGGYRSKNLCLPPHNSTYANDSIIAKSNTYMDSGKLYSVVTSSGGAGVSKSIYSPFNPDVRGLLPPNFENSEFVVYFGVWIRLISPNFNSPADTYPFVQIVFEDSAGTTFNAETPARTQIFNPDAFDNTNTSDWQFVGALRPLRWTFATGLPIVGVSMRISLGDDSEDWAANAHSLWIAEPDLRIIRSEGGMAMDNSFKTNDIVTTETYTLASGGINIPYTESKSIFIKVDTEASAATDDLANIVSPQLTPGTFITISSEDDARTVVLKDGSGNLVMNGDFDLDNTQDTIMFVWDGTNAKELTRSNNGV